MTTTLSDQGRKAAGVLAILLAASILAGCIGSDDVLPPSLSEQGTVFDGTYTWVPPMAHDPLTGAQLDSPLLTDPALPRYVERLIPGEGAEPNLGVTSSGAVFVTLFDSVYRSRDDGETWEHVHELESPNYPVTEDWWSTGDPMLWVDSDTDRVYISHLYPRITCTYLSWSDDEGETWFERTLSCGTPLIDHQKIMTAPLGPQSAPGTEALMQAYPNVFYMCYNKLDFGTYCSVSLDGGSTFAYDTQVAPLDKLCGAINGHPVAYPDGTVAITFGGFAGGYRCSRAVTVAVTEDNGLTWQQRQCAPDFGQAEIDPDMAVTPDGTAYVLFRDTADQRAYMLRSTEKFQNCEVFEVAPADHTMNVFAGIASGDDGHIAMAYLGTRDPQDRHATPSNARQGSHWHLFLTTSMDADAAAPTFITQQVTPQEDPVQVGCVWLGGGAGGPFQCRNLLDFIDMVRDDEGRAYIAITDGCTPRRGCTGTPEYSDWQSRDRQVALVVQDAGYSLFGSVGVLPSLGATHPLPAEH